MCIIPGKQRSIKVSELCVMSLVGIIEDYCRSVSFALFDSRLEQLRLPMTKFPTSRHIDENEAQDDPRLEHVHVFVKKYFEWHIESSEGENAGPIIKPSLNLAEVTPSSRNGRQKRCMALHRINETIKGTKEPVEFWTWWEGPDDDSTESEKPITRLFWDH